MFALTKPRPKNGLRPTHRPSAAATTLATLGAAVLGTVVGLIIGANIGGNWMTTMSLFGWHGYEATAMIGAAAGAFLFATAGLLLVHRR